MKIRPLLTLLAVFTAGFLVAAILISGAWSFHSHFGRVPPPQRSFDSEAWKQGDSRIRGGMYTSLVAKLQSERPEQTSVTALLGPPAEIHKGTLIGGDTCLIYPYDGGQRFSGYPFLNKLGISYNADGTYYNVTSWD